MKLAVVSESPADEAAVRILVEGILRTQTQPIASPPLRTRGWPSILQLLPGVLKGLYYRTDAEALALVVDSNDSPSHQKAHNAPGAAHMRCRLCRLREAVAQAQSQTRHMKGRLAIKTAIGLAVPAIEAWYRCEHDPHVTEAAWVQGLQSGNYPYSKNDLKRDVYGTDRPSLAVETHHAVDEARRLVQMIDVLESSFPGGFGALASDVRRW